MDKFIDKTPEDVRSHMIKFQTCFYQNWKWIYNGAEYKNHMSFKNKREFKEILTCVWNGGEPAHWVMQPLKLFIFTHLDGLVHVWQIFIKWSLQARRSLCTEDAKVNTTDVNT